MPSAGRRHGSRTSRRRCGAWRRSSPRVARTGRVFAAVADEVGRLLGRRGRRACSASSPKRTCYVGRRRSLDRPGILPAGRPPSDRRSYNLFTAGDRPEPVDDASKATVGEDCRGRTAWLASPLGSDRRGGRPWGTIFMCDRVRQRAPTGGHGARSRVHRARSAPRSPTRRARAALRRLADEQAALRRVATLVAGGTRPE